MASDDEVAAIIGVAAPLASNDDSHDDHHDGDDDDDDAYSCLAISESCTEMTYDGDMTEYGSQCCDGSYCDSQSNKCTLSRHPITAVVERQAPSIYHCRDGGSNGTCYTFWKGCSACGSLSSFNDEAHSPWTYSKAESMCTGLSANNDSIPEDVFGTDHCPGTDAPHVNDDLLITTTSRHEYSIFVTVIVYDAASVRALAGALATSEQGSEGALAVFNISMPAGEEYVPSSVERKVYGVDDDAWHGAAVVYLDAITGNMTMTIAPDPLIAYSRLNCSTSQAQECASKCRRSHRVPAE